MSRVVKNAPCPRCRERGKDSRGDNLVVYEDGAHCFSCGYHEHPKHYVPKIKEIYVSKVLPSDFTREIPTHAWKWLLQYGLSYNYWKEHVGYSPTEQRLVFLVPSPNPVFSLGRYVGENEGTSYIPKWKVWGDSHTHTELLSVALPTGRRSITVLVEDLLSAHKVAAAGFSAIPLFGVVVYPCHVKTLRASNNDVVLWFDKDQEGGCARKVTRLQLLINRPVHLVHTRQDPKLLSLSTIQETINELF